MMETIRRNQQKNNLEALEKDIVYFVVKLLTITTRERNIK